MQQVKTRNICQPGRIAVIAVLVSLLGSYTQSACKKNQTLTTCSPERNEYTFQLGKQIDRTLLANRETGFEHYDYTVKDGNNIVFQYTQVFKDCPQMADDEGSRVIIFEVPNNVTSFQLKDSADLSHAKAIIAFMCFCSPGGPISLKYGLIEGQKTGPETWHLKGSLKPSPAAPTQLEFEANFIRK